MTLFELALEYAERRIQLGALYYDQDRAKAPEAWILHDEAYKALYEACKEAEKTIMWLCNG